MASSKAYLEFILEQLSNLEEITYRAMMGEYVIYYRGKIVGGIYDDRLLVKPVTAAIDYMPNARYELPYENAKEMLLVDEVDNKAFLTGLLKAMYDELPAPKQKKRKGNNTMWKCPNCGREFKKENQQHYCNEKPKTIDEYIMLQDSEKQSDLLLVRSALQEALPEAQEKISWSMPTYWQKHNIIHFAASKKHIGLYPGPAAVVHFEEELKGYSVNKGTIRIPYGKVDVELIKKIAKWCYDTENHA